MSQKSHQVIIIGGGLAGLISALHLSRANIDVLVIEKDNYPKHKVCGEYISNEVLPYLKQLGFDPFQHGAKDIKQLSFSSVSNKEITTTLPLGGFGISRYTMDAKLAKLAASKGASVINGTVSEVTFSEDKFFIKTRSGERYQSTIVIGAFGKRSNIDVNLSRKFLKKKSPYLAVKAHYKGDFPDDKVSLHNFKGGYCGVSKVDTDHINMCYITDYKTFKKYKNIYDFQTELMSQNKHLRAAFEKYELVFDKPITIGQVSFSTKKAVEKHMLMCGDSAGMIHPFAGNGMSMAIRSAHMASKLIIRYLNGEVSSREHLEKEYQRKWRAEFHSRLNVGHVIAAFLKLPIVSDIMINIMKAFPSLLPSVIKKTHGKPMTV